jgi:hypothetical protein
LKIPKNCLKKDQKPDMSEIRKKKRERRNEKEEMRKKK